MDASSVSTVWQIGADAPPSDLLGAKVISKLREQDLIGYVLELEVIAYTFHVTLDLIARYRSPLCTKDRQTATIPRVRIEYLVSFQIAQFVIANFHTTMKRHAFIVSAIS